MRPIVALGVAALALSGGGCALVTDATCLTAYEVRESLEDCRESARNRKWAEQAWANERQSNPNAVYSEDYARGFRDGFAHFLFRGGNGDPPPLPPKQYRGMAYQTPQGYRAIEDWFAGFRHGAGVARASGFRDFVTGPSALRTTAAQPVMPGPEACPAEAGGGPVPPAPREVPLPPPTVVPAPALEFPEEPPPPADPPAARPGVRILGVRHRPAPEPPVNPLRPIPQPEP